MKPRRITVNDRMQQGYRYMLIEPVGRNYDEGFHPELTPRQLLALGVFGVNASQPLSVWRRKRWICHEDPRGWFQWYCRYYLGRRSLDDARQIRRWRQMARHVAQIRRGCMKGDLDCRRRQRQALLHWAYDSRAM